MILKQLLLGSLAFVAIGFTSCAGSDKEGASTEKSDTLTNGTTPASSMVVNQAGDTTAIQVSGQAPVAQAATGMNPAHGQPGHDCKIAVGAPLNSAPSAQGAAQPIQVQQVAPQATPAAQPSAAGGSGKVNPAHGQPGHDCKVAVGAPLP